MHKLRPRLNDELRAAMRRAFHGSSEARRIHRLHAVLLVSLGSSCYQVAHWFDEDPRTVERWVHAFEQHGADGLLEHARSGRTGRLTAQQTTQLAAETSADPAALGYAFARWSGKLLAQHLERRYGVQLSQRQCQRLLQNLRH